VIEDRTTTFGCNPPPATVSLMTEEEGRHDRSGWRQSVAVRRPSEYGVSLDRPNVRGADGLMKDTTHKQQLRGGDRCRHQGF
jgi:hypothetical protein